MCVDTTTIRNNCVNHSDYLEVNNLVFGLPVVTEAMGRDFLGGNLSKYIPLGERPCFVVTC